jgi:hypothetical protein
MLTRTENILILIVMMVGSMLFMKALNRVWPREKRREHNDLIGWQLGILGTTYAVILGFMLYTVWTTYGAAELNADLEANALRNVYRLAEGLPEPQRVQLAAETRAYADAVVENDWPEMASSRIPEQSHLRTQLAHRTSPHASAPKRLPAAYHLLVRPPHGRRCNNPLGHHVRVDQRQAPRPSGVLLYPAHHTCPARHRRRQSPLPRLGPRQQLRLRTSSTEHEGVAVPVTRRG